MSTGQYRLSPGELELLRDLLKRYDGSQNQFAVQICGVSPATLSRVLHPESAGVSRQSITKIRKRINPSFAEVEPVRIVTSEDLLYGGKSCSDILNEVMNIDASIPGVQLHAPPPHVVEAYSHHYQTYPDLCPYLVTANNKIVGYYGILPLVDSAFEDLLRGATAESVSRLSNIPPLGICGPCDAYINGLAILEPWSTFANQRLLFEQVPKMLYQMARQKVYFKRFGAHAWSPEGKLFIEAMEMVPVINASEGWFYARNCSPWPRSVLFDDIRLLRRYRKAGLL